MLLLLLPIILLLSMCLLLEILLLVVLLMREMLVLRWRVCERWVLLQRHGVAQRELSISADSMLHIGWRPCAVTACRMLLACLGQRPPCASGLRLAGRRHGRRCSGRRPRRPWAWILH